MVCLIIRRPLTSQRTYTLVPNTTLVRSEPHPQGDPPLLVAQHAVVADDGVVAHGAQDRGLAPEQLHDLLVGGEVRADNLDRVLGADLGMAGLVDLAHAAARQQGLYLIGVADQAADLEKGRMVVAARGRAEAAGRAAAAAGVFAHCCLLASRGRSARLSGTPAAPPPKG